MSPLRKIVVDWIGLNEFEADQVMNVLFDLAEDRGIDFEEATVADIRKLADEAFEICNEEGWR